MSWTGRPEADACCDGSRGAVCSDERVARITVRPLAATGYTPFRRSDFFPPTDGQFSNQCGNADGFSVDRCDGLSEDDIRLRSATRAASANLRRMEVGKQPSQSQDGAIIAKVQRLRELRLDDLPAEQVVYVYDDPLAENDRHAVIRCSQSVPEEERATLLTRVERAFDTRISTPTHA